MLARIALAILAAVALCSGATAQSPTKVFRIGLVHVGIPGSCILAPGFTDAFARRGSSRARLSPLSDLRQRGGWSAFRMRWIE